MATTLKRRLRIGSGLSMLGEQWDINIPIPKLIHAQAYVIIYTLKGHLLDVIPTKTFNDAKDGFKEISRKMLKFGWEIKTEGDFDRVFTVTFPDKGLLCTACNGLGIQPFSPYAFVCREKGTPRPKTMECSICLGRKNVTADDERMRDLSRIIHLIMIDKEITFRDLAMKYSTTITTLSKTRQGYNGLQPMESMLGLVKSYVKEKKE